MNSISYRSAYFWLLMVLLALLLLVRLGATPIYILDEAKNAQCAREMFERGDFIVPTFNNALRTDKPPLHYFFMIAAYKIFGVTEFAARFFSAIMGILTVSCVYVYSRKYLTDFTAFCSSLILVVSSQFLFEFRLAVPDPYLIFFITLGLFSGFTWLQENKDRHLFISVVALGSATLAKGPVALALPGVCLLIWVIIKNMWKTVFTWKLLPAFALLCLIVFPWYIAVDKATDGAWTRGFFLEHNLNRFSDPQEGHGGFFLITLLFVLIGLLPFTTFTGELLKKRRVVFEEDVVKFSSIVVLVFVIFFSVSSTKLPNYPMPCYAFAAVILGRYISALADAELTSKMYPIYILFFLTVLIPVAGYFAIENEEEAKHLSWLPLLLLIVPVGFYIVLRYSRKNKWSIILSIGVVYTLFNIIGLLYLYPKLYSQNPVSKTLHLLRGHNTIYSYIIHNPGYNFYLDTFVQKYDELESLQQQLQHHPDALVISRKEYVDTLQTLNLKVIASHHDLFESPTTVILEQNAKP